MTTESGNPNSGSPAVAAEGRGLAGGLRGERGGLGWFAGGFIILLWAYATYRLGTLWYGNEQYSYGWFVPLLCALLFWERWKLRPRRSPVCAGSGTFLVLALLSLGLLPAILFLEIIPFWRFAGWIFAITIVAISVVGLYFVGGRSYARHFLFPLLFFLLSIPWPARIELPVIEQMSWLNAACSTLAVNYLGTPAVQHGVLIETGPGLVGVDQACSGIRSFQASVMVGLFLGELFLYGFFRRMLLLFGGASIALLCNVIRTTYLVRTCDVKGLDAVNVYHDQAGFTILGITFAGLLLLAWLTRPRNRGPQGQTRPEPWESNQRSPQSPLVSQSASPPQPQSVDLASLPPITPRRWLRTALVAVSAWVMIIEACIAFWFGSAERSTAAQAAWSFVPPAQEREFRQKAIKENTRKLLRYDEGIHAEWRDAAGRAWQAYYMRWLPAKNRYRAVETVRQSREHETEVCLPLAGMTLQTNWGVSTIEFEGVSIQAGLQRFLSRGTAFHVMSAYWEPYAAGMQYGPRAAASTSSAIRGAWQALKARDRGTNEKRVIKIGVWDMENDAMATQALRECLKQMMGKENTSAGFKSGTEKLLPNSKPALQQEI